VLLGSTGITLSDNTVMYNEQRGIWVADGSNNNVISGNNASHNGFYGIQVKGSDNNIFSRNNASYNGKYGVSLNYMSDNNEIYDNIFCDNTQGDYEDEGENNDIHDNSGCSAAGPTVPGYPLVWILGFVVCGFTVLLRKTLKKSKRKQ